MSLLNTQGQFHKLDEDVHAIKNNSRCDASFGALFLAVETACSAVLKMSMQVA